MEGEEAEVLPDLILQGPHPVRTADARSSLDIMLVSIMDRPPFLGTETPEPQHIGRCVCASQRTRVPSSPCHLVWQSLKRPLTRWNQKSLSNQVQTPRPLP